MAFTQEGSFTTYNREDDFILKTLPSLLSEKLPDYQIEMQVLRTHELVALARKGEIDIVFGSSGCFASLIPDGIYALATLVTKSSPDPNAAVAGALIVRADRSDLQTIEDLKGKRAIGGITGMFFNYQMPVSAVVDRGYDPEDFFGVLRQVDYPVLKTLEAVKNGRADVGLIRACTLEELPPDEQKHFRVIEPVADSPLRCAHTSRTFPNWTVGAMSHVPSEVAKKISVSLLEMPAQTSAGIAWSIANSFSEIDGLFKSLKFGRYEYLRHWTFERFWSVSWPFVMAGLIALLGLLLHLSRVQRLVAQRTAELRTEMANREELEKHNAVITEKFHRLERISTLGLISNMVAHELRQPLSTLSYCLATMGMVCKREKITNATLERAIAGAKKQSGRINDIVEHVCTYARNEDKSERVEVAPLIDGCVNEALQTGLIRQRPKVTVPGSLVVLANRLELQLVFFNLFKNSAEAAGGEDSGIEIEVTETSTEGVIVLKDRAKVLTENDVCHLGIPTPSMKEKGLGLGLSIVKTIIESRAGRIHFRAAHEKGLIVTITLPKAPSVEGA